MSDRNPISRRRVLTTAAALACASAPLAAQEPRDAPVPPAAEASVRTRPRTVILVRHGEKASDDPRDPSLSEAGKLRAAALLRLLGETRITHVWTSEFKRTRDFVTAVAQKHQLAAETMPGKDSPGLAARLKAMPEGSIALVAGHSNTLPAVARALGASLSNLANGTDFRDDEYDRFVVITLAGAEDPCSVLEMRYGA